MILTTNDIKAELSYAYLHAVASRAGLECTVTGRHGDGAGVDAVLRARERFLPESTRTHFTVDIQLKATSTQPAIDPAGRFSFSLTVDHYNKLRDPGNDAQQILVVLILPENDAHWLSHSADNLVARRCAYWVSLWNAPASPNETRQVIYIPGANLLSVESLRSVMARASLPERIPYEL